MKKIAIADEPRAAGAAWPAALERFAADLRRRGAAEPTRRAYAVDVGQLADWAQAAGLAPEELGARDLRRFVAHLAERPDGPYAATTF